MGSNSKGAKKDADVSLLEEGVDFGGKLSKKLKPYDGKGTPTCNSLITEEWKNSSGPPSPVSFLSLDGRTGHKLAEMFRTDLISAMKLPDSQLLNPENYISITDTWRQEWERGVQVPVHPDSVSQASARPVETDYKKPSTFKLPGKLLNSDEKRKGRNQCIYDLSRMDVEWLNALNKFRRNKGRIELEESALEKAVAYLEDKCYENMGYAIATQKGLSIEYDESVCCDVCQSPDSEEGNEMVFCDSCDICVHQACYGIQSIPSGSWLCQPCRWGVPSPPCRLCSNKGGAMKKAKGGKTYIHVSCALWVPEVAFGNVERMEPIIKVEKIRPSRWNLVCYICKEKVGACIQCTVKSCVTAFHVTCGFSEGLDMKTVLDETAVDGVKHVSYCAKHGYKNKSPGKSPHRSAQCKNKSPGKSPHRSPHCKNKSPNKSPHRSPQRSPEKIKQNKEEAENLRQKRLKQMEGEFYKYVDVGEAAKDLGMQKELLARIHAYWTLKRKARDDVPLLPPTSQQQEKLLGKQGAADISRNLQIQIERLMKMRCDLERLRNLCYMVGKREKMRRELFRVREKVFWQAHEVMIDESIEINDGDMTWIRGACRENFSGDGSAPVGGPDGGNASLTSSKMSTSSGTSIAGSNVGEAEPQSREGGGESGPTEAVEDLRGDEDSSDSDSSTHIRTRRRSLLAVQNSTRSSQTQEAAIGSNQDSNEVPNNPSDSLTPASPRHSLEEERSSLTDMSQGRTGDTDYGSSDEGVSTPRRSLRILSVECPESSVDEATPSEPSDKVPSPRTKWKEHVGNSEVPQTPRTRRQTNSKLDIEERKTSMLGNESEGSIGPEQPRTKGKGSESKATVSEGGRNEEIESSPARLLRSRRQLAYSEACNSSVAIEPSTVESDQCFENVLSDSSPARVTRAARLRRTSTSVSDGDELQTKLQKTAESNSSPARETRSYRSERTSTSTAEDDELPRKPTKQRRNTESHDSLPSETSKLCNSAEWDNSPVRETRSARMRRISLSTSGEDEVTSEMATRLRKVCDADPKDADEVLKENQPQLGRKRDREFSDCGLSRSEGNALVNKRRKSDDVRVHRCSRNKTKHSRRRSLNDKNNQDVTTNQSRITQFLLAGSSKKNRPPKAEFRNGYKSSDSTQTDCENTASDEENAEDRVQRLTSLRSFTNGMDIAIPESPCPDCQIQHHRHPEYSPADFKDRSPSRRGSVELKLRHIQEQSPRSRGRLSSGLRLLPGRACGNLLTRVCRGNVT